MKRKILFGLFNIIMCLSLIGLPSTGKVNVQPVTPDQVSIQNQYLVPTLCHDHAWVPTMGDLPSSGGGLVTSTPFSGWSKLAICKLVRRERKASETGGAQVQINSDLIPAINPGQLQGNDYQYVDTTAEVGKKYNYWIEWVGNSSSELFEPITASLPLYMVWLPLGLK